MLSCHVHLLSLRALLFSEGKRQRSVSGVEGVHGVKERGMEEWETGWYVLYKTGKKGKKKTIISNYDESAGTKTGIKILVTS